MYEGQDIVLKDPISIIIKKGKKEGEYLKGYDAMAQKLAQNVVYWLQQQTEGKDKQ